ncbi:MAG: hypothetical protein KY393_08475, partial [Actinobacteria bacterium]|nr:hypothetical protein [Actinomycetota bacterium]
RSTLADANANRPAVLFADLFATVLAQAQRALRRKVAETVYLIDSTSLKLNGCSEWARFSTDVAGASKKAAATATVSAFRGAGPAIIYAR